MAEQDQPDRITPGSLVFRQWVPSEGEPEAESADATAAPEEVSPEAAPPAEETVNPYTMSKAEFEAWAAGKTDEELRKVLAEKAPDPLEIIRMRRDYHKSKEELAAERRRLQQERDELLGAIKQALSQQSSGGPPAAEAALPSTPALMPPTAPMAPTGYEGYLEADPRVQSLEARLREQDAALRAIQDQFRQMVEYEIRRDLKARMQELSREHSWFTPDMHDDLYRYMSEHHTQDVETAFRAAYLDQLVAERAAAMAGQRTETVAPQGPPPLAPKGGRVRRSWREGPLPKSPEEFARILEEESSIREE